MLVGIYYALEILADTHNNDRALADEPTMNSVKIFALQSVGIIRKYISMYVMIKAVITSG